MRLLRFATVGVANTAVDYGAYSALVMLGLQPQLCNVISVFLAASFSFVANRHFTFAEHRQASPLPRQLYRHAATTLSALAIPAIVIAVAAPAVGPLAAKALAIPLVFTWNYTLASRWVWRGQGAGE